jgi:hypothetical protein
MAAPEPVVETSEQGAGELSALYWREVERFMRGLVATNVNADGSVQLRLRPGSLVLLAFGPPERTVADDGVRCTYPIVQRVPRAQGRWDDLVFARDGSATRARLRDHPVLPAPRGPSGATWVDRRALRAGAAPPPPGRLEALLPCPSRRRAGVKVVSSSARRDDRRGARYRPHRRPRCHGGSRARPRRAGTSTACAGCAPDVDDEQSVARAMEGAEVAYYLVHSLGKAGFEERERRSADGFARAA